MDTLAGGEDEEELTHYGQSLSKLDDFDNIGLGLEDEEEDTGKTIYELILHRSLLITLAGLIDRKTVEKTHFGGFEEEGDSESDQVGDFPIAMSCPLELFPLS